MIDINNRPLSFSSLSQFDISPVHYIKYITQQKKTTPQMLLGSIFHTLVLEPNEIGEYAVMPKVDLRTTKGKDALALFEAENAGKTIVDSDTWQKANDMVAVVKENKKAVKILDSLTHVEHEFKMDINGLPIRGFIDGFGVYNDTLYYLELKTAQSANPSEVVKDFYNKKYHLQAGLYLLALQHMNKVEVGQVARMMYIVIENTEPFIVSVFEASPDYIMKGVDDILKLINRFDAWMQMGFPVHGYSTKGEEEIFTLDLPKWISL